jgi:hypothetical protein
MIARLALTKNDHIIRLNFLSKSFSIKIASVYDPVFRGINRK